MDREALSAELRALAETKAKDPPTKTGRLRALLPEVEAALAAGATHAEVVEKLRAFGLDMTVAVFGKTLERLRRAGKNALPSQPAMADEPAPMTAAPGAARPAVTVPPGPRPWNEPPPAPTDLDQLIKHGKQRSQE
jgi:hypothetical protein